MSFLSPLFLLGGLAVTLPLWLHLLERENPVRLPFSSLMFFERRTESSLKERKLRYLMLLAARVALYALLALAFAKPVWERTAGTAALGSLPQLRLIVMDTSLSMNYADRWERAVAAGEAIVNGMAEADRAQVLATGPSVRVITQPSNSRQTLISAIRSLQPTASKNSYGDLAEAVRSLSPEDGLPVTVHVVSDFQASAMPGRFSEVALPTMAALEVRNLAEPSSPNWTVESIKGTTHLYGAAKARLEATVAGFGTEKATKRVTLSINGQIAASKTVEAPASGRASVVFEGFEVPTGNSRAEVVLESGDELPLDDKRLVAIDNSEPDPILFVSNDPRKRDLLYYRAALDASPQTPFRVESASVAQAERLLPDPFAFVVLSDVPQFSSAFVNRLEEYVRDGGSVLLAMGPKTTLAGRAPLYVGQIEEARYTARESDRFQLAGEVEQSHPALQQIERFRSVKFFRYAKLRLAEGDDVLARLSDGSPLLVEQKLGEGRVLALATSLDNIWNDLPVHPVFVPFVGETARYLSGLDEDLGQTVVDSVLELSRRRTPGAGVQVFDPRGERVLSLSESVAGQDVQLTELGFYEVRRTGQSRLIAVNPDPRESNLRAMDAEMLALWEKTGRNAGDAVAAGSAESPLQPPPINIWRFILLLLILITLIESIVGNWHLKVQREV